MSVASLTTPPPPLGSMEEGYRMCVEATRQAFERSPWKGNPTKWAVHLAVADTVNEKHGYLFWMNRAELAEKAGGASRRSVDGWFVEALEMGLMVPVRSAIPGRRSAEFRYDMGVLTEEGNDCRLQRLQSADCNDCSPKAATVADENQGTTQDLNQQQTEASTSSTRAAEAVDVIVPLEQEETRGGEPEVGSELAVAQEAPPPTPSPRSPVRMIFDLWIETSERDPKRVKLTGDRERKVKARMNEGYDLDDCLDAVRGIRLSEFHMGDNDRSTVYDDLTVVFKSGTNVERFRDLWREHGATGVPVPGAQSVAQRVLGDMVKAGIDPDAEMGTAGLFGARRSG